MEHAPCSSLDKMDSVQVRVTKTIIGAAFSSGNVKSQQECGLQSFESRRRIQVDRFTNKIRNREKDHIGIQVFYTWRKSTRLK
ncbi:hypothetical protein TNIN_148941 [Trichonephila inaurata madagascariensis]|uniref:Uncharacterized protein n=1 Tax=Trichonephila inaurata madagascariensis TaxID=2747483 RepID=A0A8X7CM37_9ARAC|nr:hypothetical protein TNIN_148941 [Trichonephila inaurata madagascariensis]